MLTQTCSSLPATCCTVPRRQTFNQLVRSNTPSLSAGQLSKPGSTPSHSFQLFNSRLQKHKARVANPRHDSEQDTIRQSTNSWDEAPPSDGGQAESQQASGVDWAKVQSLAALTGASTLAAVVVLQLSGKADISRFAYDNVAESMQQALPEQRRGQQDKAPRQLFDVGAFLQTAKVSNFMCNKTPCQLYDSKQHQVFLNLFSKTNVHAAMLPQDRCFKCITFTLKSRAS